MKIALIGTGKTGSKVLEVINKESVTSFNRSNPVTVEGLKEHDVAICFVSGETFLELTPLLIASGIPVVSGATGLDWSEDLLAEVRDKKLKWIHAANFSIGMNFIRNLLAYAGKILPLLEGHDAIIHEVHHVKKLDAPSGTALKWKLWLNTNKEVTMTYERTGDVIGDHELILENDSERISIRHTALDRKLFARGAVYAAKELLENKDISYGVTAFEDFIDNKFQTHNL